MLTSTNYPPVGESMEPSKYRVRSLAVVTLLAVALAAPSVLIDKEPYNFDESAFLVTGTYFSSAIADLGSFLSDPAGWSKEYYKQYPSISLRRHPPLFFLFEGIAYKLFGTSFIAARLALMAFTVAMSTGFFLVAHRYFKDSALAVAATLLLLAVSCRVPSIQEVWLDVPTMAWTIWGLLFWDLWRTKSNSVYGFAFALCCLCALYTYQLSLFMIVAMLGIAGLFWMWPKLDLSQSSDSKPFSRYLLVTLGFLIVLLPLVIFTVVLGKDQLQVAAGGQVEEFARFRKSSSSLSAHNLLFYLNSIVQTFPIALAGTVFLILSRVARHRKIESLDIVLLAATLITYAGFTMVSSGNIRYAWYIVVPTVLWATDCLGWIASRIAPRMWQPVLCITVASLLLVESATRDYNKRFITEPVDMQQAFELVKGRKNLLYSGTFDARFIFTVRSQDPQRQYRLFRGSVQFKEKDDLREFVDKNKIDAVLVQLPDPKKVSAEYQRLERKFTAELPGLGFTKIQTLYGREVSDTDGPMLDIYLKKP